MIAFLMALVMAGPVSLSAEGKQPVIACGQGGRLAVAYGVGETVFCRVSGDGGRSFDAEVRVGSVPKLMLGMRRGPQIAIGANGIVVTAVGKEGDLLAWRSANGKSWQGPTAINDTPRSAEEGLTDICAALNGTFWAVWLDDRSKRKEIYAARSMDGGKTWQPNQLVYASPGGSVCECCKPSIVPRPDGVNIMFRNSINGYRDMYLCRLADGKVGPSSKLGDGTWKLGACPMDGGGIACDSRGKATTVWRREGIVYVAEPDKAEWRLGDGSQAVVCATPAGPCILWQQGSDISGRMPDGTIRSYGPGSWSRICGMDGAVFAVWEAASGVAFSVIRMEK